MSRRGRPPRGRGPRSAARLRVAVCLGVLLASLAAPSAPDAQGWQVDRPVGDAEVVRRYQEILARDPTSERGLTGLISEYGPRGGVPALLEEYASRAAAEPDDASLQVVLARLRMHEGRYVEALPALDRALALGLDRGGVYRLRGEARGHAGDREGAAADFEAALERARYDQERIEVLRALGDLQLALGREAEALESYGRIAEIAPRDRYVRQELAQILYEAGFPDEALARYREVVELAGTNTRERATALREVAILAEELGRHDEATASWERILALVGSDHWLTREAQEGMVRSYRAAGRLEELAAELAGRDDAFARRRLPALLAELGRPDEAEAAYRELVAAGREEPEQVLEWAELLATSGRIDQADAALADAAARWPERLELTLARADLALAAGRAFDASYVLRQARERLWDDAAALDSMLGRLRSAGDDEEAARVVARIRELSPEDPTPLLALAEDSLDRGDSAGALEALRPLTESDDPAALRMAIETLLAAGESLAAEGLLWEAQSRFPDDERLALLALQQAPPDDTQALLRSARELLVAAQERDVLFEAFDLYYELVRRFGLAEWAMERFEEDYLRDAEAVGAGRAALLTSLALGRADHARSLLTRLNATAGGRWRGEELVVAAVERWPAPGSLSLLRRLGADDPAGGWRFGLAAAGLELAAGREEAARSSLSAVLDEAGELPLARFEAGQVWAGFASAEDRATGCRLQQEAMDAEPARVAYRLGAAACRLDLGQAEVAYQLALDGFEVVRDPLEADDLLDLARRARPRDAEPGALEAEVRARVRGRPTLSGWLEERFRN